MFCAQCGKELPGTAKFCLECGARVANGDPGAGAPPAEDVRTGGGAYVREGVDTGGGPFVGRDLIVKPDAPPKELRDAKYLREAYLHRVVETAYQAVERFCEQGLCPFH